MFSDGVAVPHILIPPRCKTILSLIKRETVMAAGALTIQISKKMQVSRYNFLFIVMVGISIYYSYYLPGTNNTASADIISSAFLLVTFRYALSRPEAGNCTDKPLAGCLRLHFYITHRYVAVWLLLKANNR
jgi:hypothetical protein